MPRRSRRAVAMLGLLLAACFAAFVVQLAPHLVHHLFDEHAQDECPFATVAERQHGIVAVVAALVLVAVTHRASIVRTSPALAIARAPSAARAPPASA